MTDVIDVVEDIIFEKCSDGSGYCRVEKLRRVEHVGRDDTPFKTNTAQEVTGEPFERCQTGNEQERCNCRLGTEDSPMCRPPDAPFKATVIEKAILDICKNDPKTVVEMMKTESGKALYNKIVEKDCGCPHKLKKAADIEKTILKECGKDLCAFLKTARGEELFKKLLEG